MAHLTEVEFNNIRELMGSAITGRSKFSAYAEQANNSQVQQFMQQMAGSCDQKVQTLLKLM